MILDIVNGEMPGYIDGATNVIDVADVARGHPLAAEKGRVGERYILGNENVTVGDLFRRVGPWISHLLGDAAIFAVGYRLVF